MQGIYTRALQKKSSYKLQMTGALHSNEKNLLLLINPGPAGPVLIRIRYACLCGGPRIDPVSPVSSFTL